MSGQPALDGETVLVAEDVTRIAASSQQARYEPAVSLFALLRERRGEGRSGPVDPIGDLEDDEDDEDEDDDVAGPVDSSLDLVGVSFAVRAGEAVFVEAGHAGSRKTLARLLCGMLAPSSGRIIVRGRIAPSVELADVLTRRETNARVAARVLATLAGPGRRHRRAYVDSVLALALGSSSAEADLARAPRELLRRVSTAAALDPFADVLVLDAAPSTGDPAFRQRWLERLAERLEEGAAAVVTADDAAVRRLCDRTVRLDGAEPAPATTHVPEARLPLGPAPDPIRAFDEHAAILDASAVAPDGSPVELTRPEEDLRVRILLETQTAAEVMVVVRFAGEESTTFTRDPELLRPGAYRAELLLPAGALEPGDYDLAIGLVLEHGGERTKVGRRRAATLRVEVDEEGLALAAEAGGDFGGGQIDAEWTLERLPG